MGYTARKAARKDATGSLTGVQNQGTGVNDIMYILSQRSSEAWDPVGEKLSVTLWESGSPSNRAWYFPSALIQNFNITYDMDTKEVVEWTVDFASDGKWYRPGQSIPGACGARSSYNVVAACA
jgi:hypothetical protein